MPAESLDDRLTALFASEPDALAEAQTIYRDLREQSPAHEHPSAVLFSRYADARVLIRDEVNLGKSGLRASDAALEALARMTESEQRAYADLVEFENLQVTAMDGAEHDRVRAIMHRAMTPSRIAALEESVQRYTDELLEPLLEQEPADLQSFAYMLPLMVICDLLGVPQSDRGLIHTWSVAIGRNKGAIPYPDIVVEADTAIRDFRAYLAGMLEEHRHSPHSTDLLAGLMEAEGDRLTTDELASNFVMMLFAGHETTTNLIGIGLLELLRHPDQWQLLCRDPSQASAAVEELLRFVTPVQWNLRVAATDFEFGGLQIPEGRLVFSMLAAANRDPEMFDDPERLDLTRSDARAHLGLGLGTHFCLGASLARLEGRVAFETLARRFPDMQLATDSFRWRGSALLRSLESLPIALG